MSSEEKMKQIFKQSKIVGCAMWLLVLGFYIIIATGFFIIVGFVIKIAVEFAIEPIIVEKIMKPLEEIKNILIDINNTKILDIYEL